MACFAILGTAGGNGDYRVWSSGGKGEVTERRIAVRVGRLRRIGVELNSINFCRLQWRDKNWRLFLSSSLFCR